jgi:nifR3 family TIM-barrel protein
MLKTPQLIGEILANMVAAVQIPITVKIRAGWDSSQINAAEIVKIAEQAGAQAICIHGRTRAQAYRGPANWDWIRDCKQVAKTIKVIGNGDIFSVEDAEKIFLHTGCDGILIARGTMGHPWIVEDVYQYLTTKKVLIHNSHERRNVFLEHLEHIVSYQDERKAVQDLRRVGCWFLKAMQGASKLREAINRAQSTLEIRQLITNYAWEDVTVSPTKENTLC